MVLFWAAFELFNAVTEWTIPSVNVVTTTASVLVAVTTIVLHEWVHGASMRLFGARPQYGVAFVRRILPVAYATAPGHRFTLRQMMFVGLAPFVVLSMAPLALAVLVPSLAFYAFLAFVTNFTGAVADLWMTAVMWRFHRCHDVYVVDQKSGLTIESPDPVAPAVAVAIDAGGSRMTRLAVASFVASVLIAWVGLPVAELFTSPDAAQVRVGPAWFPLVEYTHKDQAIWLHHRNLAVASVLLALPIVLIPRRKRASDVKSERTPPDLPGVPAFM